MIKQFLRHLTISFATVLLGLPAFAGSDFELEVERVTDNVYALVGPIGPRNEDNLAMNNTMGFVIADGGVIVVDSGATYRGGALIESAVASVTDKPIKWVINTGSQDHRWLGNGYFAEKGAEIIALERTVEEQKSFAQFHLLRLENIVGTEGLAGTVPVYSNAALSGDEADLNLGGMAITLRWMGAAHFPEDIVVIVPSEQTVFTGDLVFVERLLGVQNENISRVREWLATFEALEQLAPTYIVPGHGHATDLAQARADTGDYLQWLIDNIEPAVEDFEDMNEVTDRLTESPFTYLFNYDGLHRQNVIRTFLQLEIE